MDTHECWIHSGYQNRRGQLCQRESTAMKTVARTGKPIGYTWRLWNDPRGPSPKKPVPLTPVHRAWVTDALTPAYKRILAEPYPAWQEMRRQDAIADHAAALSARTEG